MQKFLTTVAAIAAIGMAALLGVGYAYQEGLGGPWVEEVYAAVHQGGNALMAAF